MLQVLAEFYPEYADEERLLIHITAGGAAGALASAVTTPLDVIKTRLQCQVISEVIMYDIICIPVLQECNYVLDIKVEICDL